MAGQDVLWLPSLGPVGSVLGPRDLSPLGRLASCDLSPSSVYASLTGLNTSFPTRPKSKRALPRSNHISSVLRKGADAEGLAQSSESRLLHEDGKRVGRWRRRPRCTAGGSRRGRADPLPLEGATLLLYRYPGLASEVQTSGERMGEPSRCSQSRRAADDL